MASHGLSIVPDAVLVRRARRGDLLAKGALFRRYRNSVYRLSHRLVGYNDADDLVQDGFEAVFAQLDRLREPKAFSMWLSAIVVRTAHKCLRRRQLLARLGLRARTPIEVDLVASRAALPEVAAEVLRGLRRRGTHASGGADRAATPANRRVLVR